MNSTYPLKKVPLCLLPLLMAPLSAFSQEAVFAEQQGFVFFEAESALPDASAWALNAELPNFSGDGYIEWTGPDLFASSGAGQGILTYTFEITNPGNYELRWRTHIAKGESNTESNDSWVRFPSGVNIAGEQGLYGWSKVFMGHFGAWFWDAKVVDHVGANVRQYFSAGTHTMQVSGRSFGHAIDKMALFKYEELDLSSNDLDVRTGTPQASIDGNQAIVENGGPIDEVAVDTVPEETVPETTPGSEVGSEVVLETNPLQIAGGINYTPGECVDERVALPAQSDIHLSSAQSFNEPLLSLATESNRILLQFDLTGVAPAVSAELHMSVVAGEGEATINTHLVDDSLWSEGGKAVSYPQNVLLMHQANAVWSAGSRYAIPLQVADLPSAPLTLSLQASDLQQPLLLASRQNSLNMPLLVISGESGFCEAYRNAALLDESNESESGSQSSPQSVGSDDDSENTNSAEGQTTLQNEQANQETSTGGSGGGVLLWLSLPLILLRKYGRQTS